MVENLMELAEAHGLPELPLKNMKERIHVEVLTPLQKAAFNDENFWKMDRNLLIQGATSSGKTLVSEILALYCMKDQKKALYLAPLRAMVSEKYEQFRKDFASYYDNIYASSSDYQMNDEDIIQGAYDLAVIVYEKFFAMLTEETVRSQFLSDCSLIIVDEIQMLSSDQRGPKLEFAIAKILENRPDIRIVGLTTCYNDVSGLKDWLDDAECIWNNDRVLPLIEQVICTDGKYISRYNPAIDGYYQDESECGRIKETYDEMYREGKSNWETLPELRPTERRANRPKLDILREILRHETEERGETYKAIIFTHSKRNARYLASEITDLFPRRDLPEELVSELNNLDDGDDIREMRDRLFSAGVAFHHSSLSAEVRRVIEEEFLRADGALNVIVATETLAIGVNLPADVIIVYDSEIKRSDCVERLEPQAYKNYIGRAGRLGLGSGKEASSYLIVETRSQIIAACERYVEARPSAVRSAYSGINPEDQAPFVLNGLPGQEFTEKDMEELLSHTISAEKNIRNTEQILEKLSEHLLVKKSAMAAPIFAGPGGTVTYSRTEVGTALAPFALSLRACWIINMAFYRGGSVPPGTLPLSYTEQDLLEEKYILDILYLVCMMPEISRLNAPPLPTNMATNVEPYIQMRNAVKAYLEKRKEKNPNLFWENSGAETAFFQEQYDRVNVAAMVKAILLELWMKEKTLEEIKKETGFRFQFNIGDLDHLGDVAGYLIEAISRVVDYNSKEGGGKLTKPFYRLSRRIRYGAGTDMTRILSCHVRGVNRLRLIRLKKADIRNYVDLSDYFRHATENDLADFNFSKRQRQELCDILDRKYSHGTDAHRVDELFMDGLVVQEFVQRHGEYLNSENTESLIRLLETVNIKAEPLYINGYNDLVYTLSLDHNQIPVLFLKGSRQHDKSCTRRDLRNYEDVFRDLNQKTVVISPDNYSMDVNEYAVAHTDRLLLTRRAFVNLLITSRDYQNRDGSESIFFRTLGENSGILDDHGVNEAVKRIDHCEPQPTKTGSVFLSYADGAGGAENMVENVVSFAKYLKSRRISYFFDTISIKDGENFVQKLDEGLSKAKVFVLFVDKRYGTTPWTNAEFYSAIHGKIEHGKYVIPLTFDEEGKTFWKNHALAGMIHYQDCTDKRKLDESFLEAAQIIEENLRQSRD